MYGLSEAVPVHSALGVCHLVPASRLCLLPWNFGAGVSQSVSAAPQIALIFLGIGRSPKFDFESRFFGALPWAAPFSVAGGALHTLPGLVLLRAPILGLSTPVRSCAVSHLKTAIR